MNQIAEQIIIQTVVGIGLTYINNFITTSKKKLSKEEIESLKNDFLQYSNELIEECIDGTKMPEGGEVLLGNIYKDFQEGKLNLQDDKWISDYNKSNMVFGFKNYLENGDYKDIFNLIINKFDAYKVVLKQCIEYGGKDNEKKLKKYRKLLDNCINENLENLKKAYSDFIIMVTYPSLKQEEKECIINESINKLNFKKYITVMQKFLDKIDNRVII